MSDQEIVTELPTLDELHQIYRDSRDPSRCECEQKDSVMCCLGCIPRPNGNSNAFVPDHSNGIDVNCRCFEGDVLGIVDAMGGLDAIFEAMKFASAKSASFLLDPNQLLRIQTLLSSEAHFRKRVTWEKEEVLSCCGLSCRDLSKQPAQFAAALGRMASIVSTASYRGASIRSARPPNPQASSSNVTRDMNGHQMQQTPTHELVAQQSTLDESSQLKQENSAPEAVTISHELAPSVELALAHPFGGRDSSRREVRSDYEPVFEPFPICFPPLFSINNRPVCAVSCGSGFALCFQ